MTEETKEQITNRVLQVRDRNVDVFRRHPHYIGASVGVVSRDDRTLIINVIVRELIDQETLPEESRVPNCVDGFPVRIKKIIELTTP
ncbi:MAG: hypothetical protein OXD46_03665 [Chloroflexi bacterium]|nr:hypothetical protein [Chloroflexota bacterium]